MKSLESLVLSYDMTVRDNGGGVVQFLYGDDGIDVGKSTCLKQTQFDFLMENVSVRSCGFCACMVVARDAGSSTVAVNL